MKIRYPSLIRLHFFFIMFLVISTHIIYSQEAGSCAEKLKNAQTLFAEGRVELVPSMNV
jgi:hypothetical protein